MFKTCTKCYKHQSVDNYHKQKNGKYGCHSQCKQCRKIKNGLKKEIFFDKDSNDGKLCCFNCGELKLIDEFYKNRLSKTGRQIYCKHCHKSKIILSMSKLSNFMKLLFKRYKNKYGKTYSLKFTLDDLMEIYKNQDGKCWITNHDMTTLVDDKQRLDNIWNVSIMFLKENVQDNIIEKSDVHLVCNLIYSSKKQFNLSENELRLIYRKIIT